MKRLKFFPLLLICLTPLVFAQEDMSAPDDFEFTTFSEYMAERYSWDPDAAKEEEVEIPNKSPLNDKKLMAIYKETGMHPITSEPLVLDQRDDAPSTEYEDGDLVTITIREFKVVELASDLTRMPEIDDLDNLEIESGGQFLVEKYYTNFENNVLNFWTLPFFGRPQEEWARRDYNRNRFQESVKELQASVDRIKRLNPDYGRKMDESLDDLRYQFAENTKNNERFFPPRIELEKIQVTYLANNIPE